MEGKIVQVLFEDIARYTIYPTSMQYTEVSRALVRKYPLLKDRACNESGYDTWKESLWTKFKHERAPLVNERVALQKEVYGHKRKSTGNAEKPLSPMQKAKARSATEELPSFGEDKKSVEKHIADLKRMASQRNPGGGRQNDKDFQPPQKSGV